MRRYALTSRAGDNNNIAHGISAGALSLAWHRARISAARKIAEAGEKAKASKICFGMAKRNEENVAISNGK